MREKTLLMAAGILLFLTPPRTCPATELYLERAIPCGPKRITALAFGPAGERAVYGTADGTLALVDIATGECKVVCAAGGREITAAALSPDGRFAAAAAKGHAVTISRENRRASSWRERRAGYPSWNSAGTGGTSPPEATGRTSSYGNRLRGGSAPCSRGMTARCWRSRFTRRIEA